MEKQFTAKPDKTNGEFSRMVVAENERKQQREETLKWISLSALAKFRQAWHQ